MATQVEIAQESKLGSRNPATGEVLGELECATPADVNGAVARARAAQREWAQTPVQRRAQVLRNFQQLLVQQKKEVAELIAREAGKPCVEALLTEIIVALDAAKFCASETHRFMRPEPVPHGNLLMKSKRGYLLREPHGVVGIIAPWNYPFSIPATQTFAALITGNALVLKPSEFTPLIALKLKALLDDAGLPQNVVQVVIGEGVTGAALCNAAIDKLVFTGSVATGRRVAQAAAARLLPVVLELGGKDAMLVLDDADVEGASSAAVWGAFVNAGQTCLSVERCFVHQNLYEKFVAACVAKTEKLKIGDGMDEATDIGPMIHQQQLRIVEGQVNEAIAQGARLLTGAKRLPTLGENFYAPTVLADVHPGMRVMQEETFGPVL
ncbi:MAG TPA: aldehyde dehydrogenase family protein, partial [Terriglobales bacterium]|nr:aldehyde dehydrogenase family protein [Terriglobales bacterium]